VHINEQFYKLETFIVYTSLFFATATVSCKALRKGFFKWCYITRLLLVLSKNQQMLISKQYFYFPFFLKKEWLTEYQWKVIALTVGPA